MQAWKIVRLSAPEEKCRYELPRHVAAATGRQNDSDRWRPFVAKVGVSNPLDNRLVDGTIGLIFYSENRKELPAPKSNDIQIFVPSY